MDHNTINLNNINFDDSSFDEVDSEISSKLLLTMWHPTRWLNWWISERKKKEIEQFLIDEKYYKVGSGKNAFSLSWSTNMLKLSELF